MHHRIVALASIASAAGILALVACSSSTSTPGPIDGSPAEEAGPGKPSAPPVVPDAAPGAPSALVGCTTDPGAPATTFDLSSATDPTGGADKFTLTQALAGFPAGGGKLTAGITTENGLIKCELLEAAAPISVANFVGLARGTRPYKDGAKWKVGRFYDGLVWHRVIPSFVIQGGDPDGVGTGGPGYDMVKENQVEEPLGTMAMAASAQVSGSQFYVVVGKGPAANYNVFGNCATETAIAISNVPTDRTDTPNVPVHMIKVEIGRCP